MSEEDFGRLARDALAAWGGGEVLRLLKFRENAVFEVRVAGGRRAALRLHRPGYQTRASIEAELVWTGALAAAGVPVPAPVPTAEGGLVTAAGERLASAVTWIEGVPVGSGEAPLEGALATRRATMEGIGDLIARVHHATDRLGAEMGTEMGAARPRWDRDGFLGDAPLWGPYWMNPAFDAGALAVLAEARTEARRQLDALGPAADFGLIHADCLRENILRGETGLWLIDFDDSGWGYRTHDLATALFQGLEEPDLAAMAEALMAGYAARRSLPDDWARPLTLFLMLRSFASAGWIITRAAPGDRRLGFYAARALRLARAVLSDRPPWA